VKALLKAELIKLRTTRTFAALVGVAVATSVLLVVLTALLSEPDPDSVLVEVYASDTSSLFILILAIVGITGEWRHRTITSSLLAAPDRLRFLAAKTMAFAAAGIVLSLLIMVAVAIVGSVILSARDLPVAGVGELLGLAGTSAAIAALLGAFGVGLGALIRNQATAIVLVLVASFALEPALMGLAPDVARFGPFFGLPVGVQDFSAEDMGFGDDVDFLAPAAATAALLAWIGVAFAASAALLHRRDLD